MKKSILLKNLPRVNLAPTAAKHIDFWIVGLNLLIKKRSLNSSQAGFTLIELIVAIIIAAILSAIAIPSWTSFIDGRRANAVNDSVLQALKQAQSEAKKNKIGYSVSFRTMSQGPEVAIYQGSPSPLPWGQLVKDSGIKTGQVILGTNITGTNTVGTTITYSSNTPQTIGFDYSGNLSSTGLINSVVAVGVPTANNSTTVLASTRRCVKIVTLLGSMQTAQKSNCNP